MEKELPIFKVHDTEFFVDVFQCLLIKKDDPTKHASFMHFQCGGGFYLGEFDSRINEFSFEFAEEYETLIYETEIPCMAKLDREGMLRKYGIEKDDPERYKWDRDFKCDPALLATRISGNLPTITLGNDLFQVDVNRGLLTEVGNADNYILLRKLGWDKTGTFYNGFYDTKIKNIVNINDGRQKIPDSVLGLEIPNQSILDSYGYLLKTQGAYEGMINEFPLHKDLRAKVVPMTKEWINETISTTRQRAEFNKEKKTRFKI